MRAICNALAASVLLLFAGSSAYAHHSFAAVYDPAKPITLSGVVTKVDWLNPHARFYVDVRDEKRTPNGQADLAAPTPRLANGKPDLSGLWEHDNPLKYLSNIAADIEGDVPFQPWARELFDKRIARRGIDDPNNFCLPTGIVEKHAVPAPFKILQSPALLVILY